MISPAYIQYRARQASLWLALPLALLSLVLAAVTYYFMVVGLPAQRNGEYASVVYLKAVRDNKTTEVKEAHSNASSAAAAKEFWERLKQKHGAIKSFQRHSSSMPKVPTLRALQRCGYYITFADGEHVFVRVELSPRHFTSTQWAVNTVALSPTDTAQR
jgi:hypothetical protein